MIAAAAAERSTADVVVIALTSLPVLAAYVVLLVAAVHRAARWIEAKFSPSRPAPAGDDGSTGSPPGRAATSHPCVTATTQVGAALSLVAQPQRDRGGAPLQEAPRSVRGDGSQLVVVSGAAPGGLAHDPACGLPHGSGRAAGEHPAPALPDGRRERRPRRRLPVAQARPNPEQDDAPGTSREEVRRGRPE